MNDFYAMISRYLDPKNDFAFKRIFGTEKNTDILISLLNAVLHKQLPYTRTRSFAQKEDYKSEHVILDRKMLENLAVLRNATQEGLEIVEKKGRKEGIAIGEKKGKKPKTLYVSYKY